MTAAAGVIAAVDPAAAGVVVASALGTAFKALAAALGGLAILWLGIMMLRVLSQPQPEPPPPGELRTETMPLVPYTSKPRWRL